MFLFESSSKISSQKMDYSHKRIVHSNNNQHHHSTLVPFRDLCTLKYRTKSKFKKTFLPPCCLQPRTCQNDRDPSNLSGWFEFGGKRGGQIQAVFRTNREATMAFRLKINKDLLRAVGPGPWQNRRERVEVGERQAGRQARNQQEPPPSNVTMEFH